MAPGTNPLCLAGGVAFNALLVASLESRRPVFVQPVAGNAGLSLGAAYYTWHVTLSNPKSGPLPTLALGPEYSAQEIKAVLENCKLSFRRLLTSDELIACVVDQLSEHRIVAWMQGRMEFGSRALGFRSILASPLDPYSTENLNVFIKRRESFRKFAASVPHELAPEYFEPAPNAQFLASISRVRPQYASTFQHALLGTESIRVHTVHAHENPLYHRLLLAAGERTGLPVLYNTSFNLFGDPLVCSPRDAVRSFFSSGIDALAVGSFLIQK
jgi:carbamoyltransferase